MSVCGGIERLACWWGIHVRMEVDQRRLSNQPTPVAERPPSLCRPRHCGGFEYFAAVHGGKVLAHLASMGCKPQRVGRTYAALLLTHAGPQPAWLHYPRS